MQDTESIGTVSQVNGFVCAVDSYVRACCDAGSADFLAKTSLADLNALIKEAVSKQQWILWADGKAKTGRWVCECAWQTSGGADSTSSSAVIPEGTEKVACVFQWICKIGTNAGTEALSLGSVCEQRRAIRSAVFNSRVRVLKERLRTWALTWSSSLELIKRGALTDAFEGRVLSVVCCWTELKTRVISGAEDMAKVVGRTSS